MIVQSEISNTLILADKSYLELTRQYINHSRLGNSVVVDIFTKLNILKVCRKSLHTLNLASLQITEGAFEHIKDLVYGIATELFALGSITKITQGVEDTSQVISGTAINWLYHSFQASTTGQTTFTGFPFSIDNVDPEALRFTINGEMMIYGNMNDYHIVASTLYWHRASLELDAADHMTIAYYLL